MYWTQGEVDTFGNPVSPSKIQRANLDGTAIEDLITSGISAPTRIALDVSNGKMYWPSDLVAFDTVKLQRANLDGSGLEDLFTLPESEVHAFAVDEAHGKMYWREYLTIRRSNLDGSGVEDVVSGTYLSSARGLALDLTPDRLYWTDASWDLISTVNREIQGGALSEELISHFMGLRQPDGIALDVHPCRVTPVVFVDADATGNRDGTSWPDAFTSLHEALYTASASCTGVEEIWVAEGTYRPKWRADPEDPRSATFVLTSGLRLYGGFAGTEAERELRNPSLHATILSGDLDGDDGSGGSIDENAYHVVTAALDGFVITAGNAQEDGGGVFNEGGSPTIANCVLCGNTAAATGGGMFNSGGNPALINCVFSGNVQPSGTIGTTGGAGMCNFESAPTVTNCSFGGNTAGKNGGGILNIDADPIITNCIFWGNTDRGGSDESAQVHTVSGTPVVTYSCIQDLSTFAGSGNIGDDPQFADADRAGRCRRHARRQLAAFDRFALHQRGRQCGRSRGHDHGSGRQPPDCRRCRGHGGV